MKQTIKQYLKQLVSDRYLLALSFAMLLVATICAVNIGLSLRVSDLQLVSHYSAFGITHLYLDQWFYLLVFVVFSLVVALIHITVAVKLLVIKGHSIAIMFAWASISIILLGWATAQAVLNVWKP